MQRLSIATISIASRRAMLHSLINPNPAYELIADITHAEALQLLPNLQPDIVVLDAAMLNINPLVALKSLVQWPNHPAIIVLTSGVGNEQRLWHDLGAQAIARLEQPETIEQALAQIVRQAQLQAA
ncbi:MAG: hypothetical protein LCH85_09665 [Chloroflexi bacterium]|nr:hypothetical protein [Chloroflexota bacterium]